ncbi:lysylphosphatidylglycerol synthase transmembrane domain-containing protein [Leptolyngbya sp. FACHB-261]|uniref:lysylphosphatidylglycerol synthase transmembrane domain-containing protein n=1 Tax=Leptolyngbya sp. FACHB-261 TaxID=2692806 RepID=UPI001688665F|nr:lysylphosphatidylglycerol synthase transmembrane domain-containing protein [Leptolyngbya sp. FACHB-261]MBD2105270.1 flippase-like domain-containing protein [Leptolyngbya sp. FACHB-261]
MTEPIPTPNPTRPVIRLGWKKILALVVSLVLLGLIFKNLNFAAFQAYFARLNWGFLGLASTFFVITALVSAERWRWMLLGLVELPRWTALKIFLAAGALNIITKAGDMVKAYFLNVEGITGLGQGLNSVIVEKLLDMAGLCVVFLLGVTLMGRFDPLVGAVMVFAFSVLTVTLLLLTLDSPSNRLFAALLKLTQGLAKGKITRSLLEAQSFIAHLKRNPWRFWGIIGASLGVWFLHLTQIYLFFRTLNLDLPVPLVFGLAPIAILAGLLPVTLGGMGTRDAALIAIFAPYAPPEQLAGIGLLISTRYWVPTLIGLPFLQRYLVLGRTQA